MANRVWTAIFLVLLAVLCLAFAYQYVVVLQVLVAHPLALTIVLAVAIGWWALRKPAQVR